MSTIKLYCEFPRGFSPRMLRQKNIPRTHARFYSVEGSTKQLNDTHNLNIYNMDQLLRLVGNVSPEMKVRT